MLIAHGERVKLELTRSFWVQTDSTAAHKVALAVIVKHFVVTQNGRPPFSAYPDLGADNDSPCP